MAHISSGSQLSGNPSSDGDSCSDRNSMGKDFGDYVLLEELARGGMGIVCRARHKELNRIVAIKMIISGEYSSDLDVQRFQLGAKTAAQLDHPGIVPIYEINSHQGQPYFAMKLVEGGSLAENRKRPLNTRKSRAARFCPFVCCVYFVVDTDILSSNARGRRSQKLAMWKLRRCF